jgi:hypothetical protein
MEASFLRIYFSVPSSDDIHIAIQPEQKNPIHNLTRQSDNLRFTEY